MRLTLFALVACGTPPSPTPEPPPPAVAPATPAVAEARPASDGRCIADPSTIYDEVTWPDCHLDGPPYRRAARCLAGGCRHACRTEIGDVDKPVDVVYRYAYDAQGRLIEELEGTRKTTYGYRDGRLDTIVYNGVATQLRYADGRLAGTTTGKQRTDLTYDDHGRLVKATSLQDDGRAFVYSYTYDADGRLHADGDGLDTRTYSYDALGRLDHATTGRRDLHYTYAPDGRIATLDEGDARWSYRYENGLLTWEDLGTPVRRRIHHIYDCHGR